MNWVRAIWREIAGLFVDDGRFALSITVWLLVAGLLIRVSDWRRVGPDSSVCWTRLHPARKRGPAGKGLIKARFPTPARATAAGPGRGE